VALASISSDNSSNSVNTSSASSLDMSWSVVASELADETEFDDPNRVLVAARAGALRTCLTPSTHVLIPLRVRYHKVIRKRNYWRKWLSSQMYCKPIGELHCFSLHSGFGWLELQTYCTEHRGSHRKCDAPHSLAPLHVSTVAHLCRQAFRTTLPEQQKGSC